jgi:hypothetical protein
MGLRVEELERGKSSKAYFEAVEEASKNEETKEYKEWKKENKKLLEKARALLEEFYKERKVDPDLKLEIFGGEDGFTIHNGGENFRPIGERQLSKEEKEKILKNLERYRSEMDAFTEFLKKKYFSGE